MTLRKAIEKPDEPRSVLISGSVHFYKDKAPYEMSGCSIRGALEYDPRDSSVRCHECGRWFLALGKHLTLVHGITAREYKIKHGLKIGSSLAGESSREAMIKQAIKVEERNWASLRDPEWQRFVSSCRKQLGLKKGQKGLGVTEIANSRKLCAAQVLNRIREIKEITGRTPTVLDLSENGISRGTIHVLFGTHNAALRLAGLGERVMRGQRYSNEELLGFIRTFVERAGRLPRRSDAKRGLIPAQSTFERRFDGWPNTLRLAGYKVPTPMRRNVPVIPIEPMTVQ